MTDPSKRYWITEQGMKEAARSIYMRSPLSPLYPHNSQIKTIGDILEIIAAHSEAASPPELEICLMCATGKSEAGIEVREAAWTHIRGEYSWRHPLVADQLISVECTCPGFVKWTNSLKAGGWASLSHAFSAGMAWQASLAAAPPQGTPAPTRTLQERQIDAEQAWEYLQSKGVANLDIERPGKDKVTLVELLSEFANGVYIGRDETDYEAVADRVREYAESWAGQPHSADPWPWDNFQVGRIIQWAAAPPQGTPAPEPDKCPACGSRLKSMRIEMLDFNGVTYFLCSDSWHSTVAAQKEK